MCLGQTSRKQQQVQIFCSLSSTHKKKVGKRNLESNVSRPKSRQQQKSYNYPHNLPAQAPCALQIHSTYIGCRNYIHTSCLIYPISVNSSPTILIVESTVIHGSFFTQVTSVTEILHQSPQCTAKCILVIEITAVRCVSSIVVVLVSKRNLVSNVSRPKSTQSPRLGRQNTLQTCSLKFCTG